VDHSGLRTMKNSTVILELRGPKQYSQKEITMPMDGYFGTMALSDP
jgi:hypothetical protein